MIKENYPSLEWKEYFLQKENNLEYEALSRIKCFYVFTKRRVDEESKISFQRLKLNKKNLKLNKKEYLNLESLDLFSDDLYDEFFKENLSVNEIFMFRIKYGYLYSNSTKHKLVLRCLKVDFPFLSNEKFMNYPKNENKKELLKKCVLEFKKEY